MYIQLNSQVLYYEHQEGPGQSLILLHGIGEDHTFFDGCLDKLGEYNVYALDLRGHGLSATPKSYRFTDMADDLSAFVASLEIEKPIIVGYRAGAIVAMLSAALNGKLYNKLILIGPNASLDDFTFGGKHEVKKLIKSQKSKGFYERAAGMLSETGINDSVLKMITVPVTVVAGEKDMVKTAASEHIAGTIADAKLDMRKGSIEGDNIWSILSSVLI